MAMGRDRFAAIMQPAFTYFSKAPNAELLDVYFREIGGYTEQQLERAIEAHIGGGRFFPKVVDLRKRITGKEDDDSSERPRARLGDHPDFNRHQEAASRLFDARLGSSAGPVEDGRGFLYQLDPIVRLGIAEYRASVSEGASEHLARSRAYSTMYIASIREFEAARDRAPRRAA